MTEPKLRFKADDGNEFPDWNGENVGNLTMELEDYEKLSSGYPLLTSSRAGIMLQSDFRDKITTDNDATVFSVVPYGKCTYRHMSDDDIFHFNINDIAENGLVSREYPVFDTVNGNSLYLLVEYLNSNRRFRKFCREMKKGGTRTRLYYKHLCEFQLFFPSLPEQQKIAEFLSTIDEIIQSTESELTAWQERKKCVMQKIFNCEVRFKADDGSEFPEWEEKKLGELGEFIGGGTPSTKVKEYWKGTTPWISSSDVSENDIRQLFVSRFITEEAIEKSATKRIPENSICIVCRVGVGKVVITPFELCTSQDFVSITALKDDICFLGYAIWNLMQRKISDVRGTSIKGIPIKDLREYMIDVPPLPEQRKIADCLSSLDEVINQINTELSAWKEFKKGLLQQMFV